MNNAVATVSLPWSDPNTTSLDASDDFEALDSARYCPTRLLSAFALLMAGHGRCVNTTMMLGDREYAMWQLARAHTAAGCGTARSRGPAVRAISTTRAPRRPPVCAS